MRKILFAISPILILPLAFASQEQVSALINGDFIIGALFPMHEQPSKSRFVHTDIKCGAIREFYGIQRAEVALQTLDAINRDPHLLPNITLGVEIRDECWYAPVALQQSIELIRDSIRPLEADACPNLTRKYKRGPLVGVVGPGSSSVALQVQNLLQLFFITQMGYSSTSRDLSDKNRFGYFLRVVPSDYYQARLMIDVVRNFGWSYVSTVNTDENYGQSGIQAFRELAGEEDVCIAREDSVLSNAASEQFDKVVQNLASDSNAHVVICFCEGATVKGLLKATKRLNMTNRFLFIGSDGWADRKEVTKEYEKEAWGSLSIRIHSPHVKTFDTYYWGLRPETNTRNPWFNEFWEVHFSCRLSEDSSLNASMKRCSGKESLKSGHRQDSKLSFVIKAFYSLAHGLDKMQEDICGNKSLGACDKLFPFNGSLFKNYLMNVTFDYGTDTIGFDENGDPPARYDIMNFQQLNDGSFDYIQIGSWNNGSLFWDQSIQYAENITGIESVCSKECPVGQYKNFQQGGKEKKCCWGCVSCLSNEILPASSNQCKPCPPGSNPNPQKTTCVQLPVIYTKWTDPEAIVAIFFALLGLLVTSYTLVKFLKFSATPVVKSSTKELCYIILAGMALSHASIFAILAKPSPISCALSRLLPGLSFAMIYAALLTKTNRIARILAVSKGRFPTRKPLLMAAGVQVLISLTLVLFQAGIAGLLLLYEPPTIGFQYHPTSTRLECLISPKGVIIPLAFDFFLIFFCTLYAIKTRNVPENFNEAKFIGFAMYTTCVIWIAFAPIYFGSDSKVITLCMCVTLSAMVTWVFLFMPKLYIIVVKPERNTRALFTTTKAIRCHIGASGGSSSAKTEKSEAGSCATLPERRSFSCQTSNDLLVVLNPKMLLFEERGGNKAKIIERDCCGEVSCQVKKIIIKLPENPAFK